ncbi:unnamed protein product [Medioppia subpectinata]|uniref:Uncharacterized protein n=1 Tax=Medioppia subpectinata TaxID=1979941 RepID=A0A7R9KVJ9_9ACAR|nr:unnamed protein product [Medioppia subpectinata]CAG2109490.1 unnamed protein product [Medioppia subpectinata]
MSKFVILVSGQRQCANLNQQCGGFAGTQCCEGEGECLIDNQNGMISDAAGVCSNGALTDGKSNGGDVTCVPFKGICGGFAGAQCCVGMHCQYEQHSDAGRCVPGKNPNLGDQIDSPKGGQTSCPITGFFGRIRRYVAGQRQCANLTQTCGGFIGTACCEGQGWCRLNDNGGTIKDATGVCVGGLACVNRNGICGGFAGAQCCGRLRCQYFAGSDAGKCLNIAGQRQCANLTQTCGGFIGTACCEGQGSCRLNDNGGTISDAQGVCVGGTGGLACINRNGLCGGFANAQCCGGLRCQYMQGSDAGKLKTN